MTIPMPEPVAWMHEEFDHTITDNNKRAASSTFSRYRYGLITTTQAEAYADARVAESRQWISVEDRLPEASPGISGWARVLAFWATTDPDYEPGGIETSWFDGRHWQGADGSMDYHGARRVTHWMPLPATPCPEVQS